MKKQLFVLIILIIGISNSTQPQGLASFDMIGLSGVPRLTVEPAQFYAGRNQMKEFIKEEMIYPTNALKIGEGGKVVLTFLINQDGTTSQLEVEESISKEIDQEAIRIFKKMLWQPATNFGQPIVTRFSLPIKFNIKRYQKYCKMRGYNNPEYSHLPIDSTCKIYDKDQLEEAPYPVFKEKNYHFGNFIAENIKYPEAAFKQNISGTVTMSFIVEPDGRASHLVPINAIGGGCVQESIRLIKLLKWTPGIINNLAVRTHMEVNITFRLDSKSKTGYSPNNQQNSI